MRRLPRQGNTGAGLTRPYGDGATAARVVAAVTALLSIGAGVIHVSAAADHTNLPVMMVGFLAVATLQVALGGLLFWRRPGALLIAAAAAMMLSSIGLWLLSRTVGMPFLPDGHMEPIGFKDGVCVLFEVFATPGLLLLLSRELPSVVMPPRLGSQALALAGVGTFVLMLPAMMLQGGHHHSHEEAVALGIHEHSHGEAGEEQAQAGGDEAHAHATGGEEVAGHDHGTAAGEEVADDHGEAGHAHGEEQTTGGGEPQLVESPAEEHTHEHAEGEAPAEEAPHEHAEGEAPAEGHTHQNTGDQAPAEEAPHQHGGDESQPHQHSEGEAPEDHGSAHQPAEGDKDGDGRADDEISFSYEPTKPGENGRPDQGGALVFRSPSGPYEDGAHSGEGHHHGGPCNPTPEQRAVADRLYNDTVNQLKRYENNPAQAFLDGFTQVIGPADRFVHMVNQQRVFDPGVVQPGQIESFMYAQTDRGLVAIGGMYIMPAELRSGKVVPTEPKQGPKVAGCLTNWHKHAGWVAAASTAGTNWEETPEMLHVWTYPGLDPWSHYAGRELSQLWQPWKDIPSFCRISPGGTNVCFP